MGLKPQTRPVEGEIEFRGLNFAYDGKPVLHDLNLRIPAGSSIAIVGPTGSGKTTLVSLIPRIYDAAPGMVLIDGRPIREFSLESLRKSIGFVPQETFLFSDRIRENIALAWNRLPIRRSTSGRSRQYRRGYRELSRAISDHGRRARHHALGRAEAAHRDCPRA